MLVMLPRTSRQSDETKKLIDQCELRERCALYRSRSPCTPIIFRSTRMCSYQQNLPASLHVQPSGEDFHFLEDLCNNIKCLVPITEVVSYQGDCCKLVSTSRPSTYQNNRTEKEQKTLSNLPCKGSPIPHEELGFSLAPTIINSHNRNSFHNKASQFILTPCFETSISFITLYDDKHLSTFSSISHLLYNTCLARESRERGRLVMEQFEDAILIRPLIHGHMETSNSAGRSVKTNGAIDNSSRNSNNRSGDFEEGWQIRHIPSKEKIDESSAAFIGRNDKGLFCR